MSPSTTVASATDSTAGEYGADQALNFTITRSVVDATALTVGLTAGGTATSGVDYTGFQASVVIPASQASVNLPLVVLADALAEGNETAMISISSGSGFTVGVPPSASATIADRPSQTWAEQNIPDPARRGASDDADGDGSANIIEYFMGTSPGDLGSRSGVEIPTAGSSTFTLRYPRARNRTDVTGSLHWSTNLTNWFASGQSNGSTTVTFTESVVSAPNADPEIVEATATVSGVAQPLGIFVRLEVQ